MPISFVAYAENRVNGTSGTATLPTGLAEGDFLGLLASTPCDQANISAPTGYTLIAREESAPSASSAAYGRTQLFYKVAGSSESAPTVDAGASGYASCITVAFRGVDTLAPLHKSASIAITSLSNDIGGNQPDVATTIPGCMIFYIATIHSPSTASGSNSDSDLQSLSTAWAFASTQTGENSFGHSADYGLAATPMTVGDAYSAMLSNTRRLNLFTLALAPAKVLSRRPNLRIGVGL